jgi:large subunit ribosomal protein L23
MVDNKAKENISENNGTLAEKVLIEPWITEASTSAMELNKYVFRVSPSSAKVQIKKAIEGLYGVKVISVNTVKIPKKLRKYGRTPGWKSGFKKATVTLKVGDKIELFQGT